MAQIITQQILIPQQVFIGDKAELHCYFNTNNSEMNLFVHDGTKEISINLFEKPLESEDYEIMEISLSQKGIDYYDLTISFKPWTIKPITFPPIKLFNQTIEFSPIKIASISAQTNSTSIKDINSPILLPYTTSKIFGIILIFLIFLILSIKLIINHKSIITIFKNIQVFIKFNQNKKQTIKKLTKIEVLNDLDFAKQYQSIMRNYFEKRFNLSFTNFTTFQIDYYFKTYDFIFKTDDFHAQFSKLVSYFEFTDLIRYSKNKIMQQETKTQILNNTKKVIERYEDEYNILKTQKKMKTISTEINTVSVEKLKEV